MKKENRLPGVKRGATFSVYLDYELNGVPEAFPASNLTAQLRAGNNQMLSQLSVAPDPMGVPGRFLLSAPTSTWPVGDVFFDVKRDDNGTVTFSDTVVFAVLRALTS